MNLYQYIYKNYFRVYMFGDAGSAKKSTLIEFLSILCLLNESWCKSLGSSWAFSPDDPFEAALRPGCTLMLNSLQIRSASSKNFPVGLNPLRSIPSVSTASHSLYVQIFYILKLYKLILK